jgi:hypothetical protein
MAQKHVKLTKDPAEGLVLTQETLGFVQQEEIQANRRGDKRCRSAEAFLPGRHLAGHSTSLWGAANAYDLHPGRAPALEQLSEQGCFRRHQVSIN